MSGQLPAHRLQLVCRGGLLCPSPVCLALESQRNFHRLELFVDLSRAHEGALGGSAWNVGLCGDQLRSAREPDHTWAGRPGHRRAGPEETGVRSGKVGQPLGHLLSLVTSSVLDAPFSKLGEPRRCHQQKRGPLGRSQEALECLAHPRGWSGQPRGSGHWHPLA